MKTMNLIVAFVLIISTNTVKCQGKKSQLGKYWQIGLGLGELPFGGSLKPSITFGYYFNEKVYAGLVYQIKDEISRNSTSFNAKSAELSGLVSSSETVAQRLLLQLRFTPFKNGPYLSGGFVFNGKDTETMQFDERIRQIANKNYNGAIGIKQIRPAGWGLALGLGYQYNFENGLSAGFEWTPAWGQYPNPLYGFSGSSMLSTDAKNVVKTKMDKGFNNSVTNMYKVFHIGVAYRFQK
tara:strand:- start:7297 stop:8010 length:714 start_codon:yes stop_codon:yes gene_type:complete